MRLVVVGLPVWILGRDDVSWRRWKDVGRWRRQVDWWWRKIDGRWRQIVVDGWRRQFDGLVIVLVVVLLGLYLD